jgi:magnesium transporter
VVSYDADRLEEKRLSGSGAIDLRPPPSGSVWVDVTGSQDQATLQRLGEQFQLHPLALEDVLNRGQRPKFNRYDDHVFVVIRHMSLDESVQAGQVSLFLGHGFVISVHDDPPELFEAVRERLRHRSSRIRRHAADYLAYALVDTVVDLFFPLLEEYGERIEALEDELIDDPGRETLYRIHEIKRDFMLLRRAAWPHREVVSRMERAETPLIGKDTRIYLRDCYEHAVQIMDTIENDRDLVTSMLDVYLSSVSNRTNEVMKVLTVMASVFIPATFLAGVYGMNFQNMPELRWGWGYASFWIVVSVLAAGMLSLFRFKRWL